MFLTRQNVEFELEFYVESPLTFCFLESNTTVCPHGIGNFSDTEIFPKNGYDFSDEDSEDKERELPDVWNVVKEDNAFCLDLGGPYGAYGSTGVNDSASCILSMLTNNPDSKWHVPLPLLMESLQVFLPNAVCKGQN